MPYRDFLAVLPDRAPGITLAELQSLSTFDRRQPPGVWAAVYNQLREAVTSGVVVRTGGGRRGDPYRFYRGGQPAARANSAAESPPRELVSSNSAHGPRPRGQE